MYNYGSWKLRNNQVVNKFFIQNGYFYSTSVPDVKWNKQGKAYITEYGVDADTEVRDLDLDIIDKG